MILNGGNHIRIRTACRRDASSIASVLAESFKEYEPLYTVEAFEATTPGREAVLKRIEEGRAWVALNGHCVVGTASAVPRGDGLYIRGMAVLPGARGRKIGWRMLACIERYARGNDFGFLFLRTAPFLLRAIRLYERFGFRRCGEGMLDLFGTPVYSMVKILLSVMLASD